MCEYTNIWRKKTMAEKLLERKDMDPAYMWNLTSRSTRMIMDLKKSSKP